MLTCSWRSLGQSSQGQKHDMRQSWYSPGLLFQSLMQKLNPESDEKGLTFQCKQTNKQKKQQNKKTKTKQTLSWRKAFLRSWDGHKVEGVTVAQKMRHAKKYRHNKAVHLKKMSSSDSSSNSILLLQLKAQKQTREENLGEVTTSQQPMRIKLHQTHF